MTDKPDPMALVDSIKADVKALVKAHVALAIEEAKPKAAAAGIMGGMFGAAGYFGLNAASLLFLAGAAGFAALFSNWMGPYGSVALGLLAMAVVLLILAGILALVGKGRLPELKKPLDVVDEAKETVDHAKAGVELGKAQVEAEVAATKLPQLERSSATL